MIPSQSQPPLKYFTSMLRSYTQHKAKEHFELTLTVINPTTKLNPLTLIA